MRLFLLLPLALSACNDPPLSEKQRNEVTKIAEDVADNADDGTPQSDNSELKVRIDFLEKRLKLAEEANGVALKYIGDLSKENVKDAKNSSYIIDRLQGHEKRGH